MTDDNFGGGAKAHLCFLLVLLCWVSLAFCLAFSSSAFSAQLGRSFVKESIADKLVRRGESKFRSGIGISDDRGSDDAYTLFRAAQIIEPDNARAQAGLDAVLIAELNRVRDLLASGKTRLARRQLNLVDKRFPKNTLVSDMQAELRRSLNKPSPVARQSAIIRPKTPVQARFVLDEAELSQKSEKLVLKLQAIAQRVASTDQGVLIYARSDAQARWIYKQMREAAAGYRIRGDLKIGKPEIALLPPFDSEVP